MSRTLPAPIGQRSLKSSDAWRAMDPSERMEQVHKIRIFAPDARSYLARLSARLRGTGPAVSGNAGLLITGPAHTGKHSLIEHLAENHPPEPSETVDRRSIVVVPPIARPDPSALTEAVELATRWRYRSERLLPGAGPAFQVNKICEAAGIRILAFDRAMFLSGKFAIAADIVPFLTGIMDNGITLVVLVGPKTLEDRILKTAELSERFWSWPIKAFSYDREWQQALHDFEAKMPFAPGSLTADTMPARLFLSCWGKLPRFGMLTQEAARNRLRNRASNDVIKLEDFHIAYSELPRSGRNPFDKAYDAAMLADEIARGPQRDVAAFTEVD